ncbi:HpcH/HpaI aldolase/citrate lyase family protein [Aureimonas mangrovi]|uniref:HpcH/HpaI aldolase/citrate lyase family protein n=1 Tax=Aureimonas mangrovi TaxID=2758041 RepID=UPI00163DBAB1|nr:CoA ester lyase [Aureimonas mangrovi]
MTDAPAAPLLLRSVLFVPAANRRALEKSAGLDADVLIFDLEDSAADSEKLAARERLAVHLAGAGRSARALSILRINRLEEGGRDDLAALADAPLDAVLLPKVESAEELQALDAALASRPATTAIWAMIETPRGIRRASEIAEASLSRPLGALVVGPNDIVLAADLQLSDGRPQLVPWLMEIVLAAKAANVAVIDGVYNDFRDEAGLLAECRQARALGFDGKTLIHPAQIAAANAAFAPSPGDIAHAQAVVEAFEEPANHGKGVVAVEGRMVERLHLRQAEALLARHRAIQERNHA